ncbi:MAG TPA: dTDP-4-dehydrorhamnose reductase [Candidatus Obscuribacterales bacterium]
MKLLVTGAGGMLGQALVPCLEARNHQVIDLPKEKLDVTNYNQVLDYVASEAPDLVIHLAAYTKVDQAESESGLAYLINGYGTENLAVACNKHHLPMLYISSDYVFDGEQKSPYTPWDRTRPLSVYGKSKLAGEKAVQRHLTDFYIVRTSWLYGPNGKNFVDTILSMAEQRNSLRVVSDQIGTPTCTLSLSEVIADLIVTERWGIYHASDDGITSWYEFAKEIVRGLPVEVIPIETKDMPRPATRPKYSVLDKTTLINTIGRELPSWQESLHTYLQLRAIRQPV